MVKYVEYLLTSCWFKSGWIYYFNRHSNKVGIIFDITIEEPKIDAEIIKLLPTPTVFCFPLRSKTLFVDSTPFGCDDISLDSNSANILSVSVSTPLGVNIFSSLKISNLDLSIASKYC